jgi:hypothetical protein
MAQHRVTRRNRHDLRAIRDVRSLGLERQRRHVFADGFRAAISRTATASVPWESGKATGTFSSETKRRAATNGTDPRGIRPATTPNANCVGFAPFAPNQDVWMCDSNNNPRKWDGATTWNPIAIWPQHTLRAHSFLVSGSDWYAAAKDYQANTGPYVFKSSDGGATWVNDSAGLPSATSGQGTTISQLDRTGICTLEPMISRAGFTARRSRPSLHHLHLRHHRHLRLRRQFRPRPRKASGSAVRMCRCRTGTGSARAPISKTTFRCSRMGCISSRCGLRNRLPR